MAANRPARTIKPPNKFLDNDLQVTSSINGLPNHVDTNNVIIGAARKLSRSVSLPKEEATSIPKRRASSIETSAAEDNKSTVKMSRQNSISPSAKVKLARKSDGEDIHHVNGESGSADKEHIKSAKVNNVVGKTKPPMAARKSASETAKCSPSKVNRSSSIITTDNEHVEMSENRGKEKTAIKISENDQQDVKESKSIDKTEKTKDSPTVKKRGKPGPKPKAKLNTKKLKSVHGKVKAALAKTPKATAERVKRKYANKKSTITLSESTAASAMEANEEVSSGAGSKTGKSSVAKRKTLKVVKLSTKPGKGKIVSKFSKGAKSSKMKNSNLDQGEKLAVKRPRLKPGPKPKKLKFDKDQSVQQTVSDSSGLTVRYKLDGSPCLKPGPKPKKEDVSADKTSQEVVPSPPSLSKTVSSGRAKPGPKPKKSITDGAGNTENVTKSKGIAPLKGKLSETKEEKSVLSSKNKGSPKSKGTAEYTSDPTRKKPGPKPKNIVAEADEAHGMQDEPAQNKDPDPVPSSSPVRNKPGPKPKKKLSETADINSEGAAKINTKANHKQLDSNVKDTQPVRAKPGPKPKKNLSDSSIVYGPDDNAKKKSTTNKSKKELPAGNSEQNNVTTSPAGAKVTSKGKKSESNNSPGKAKPGPKAKKAVTEGSKSSKSLPSPTKPNTDSPKLLNKKLKKGAKRKASLSNTGRQDSTSDESDTLYSLADPERKKFKFDGGTDSATSSDSEVVLRRPVKTSPSPRKMLLKDSIRPKNLESETDLKKANSLPQNKSPSKSAPPGVFKKMASITAPGTSQGIQPHSSDESKLGVYMKDLPTMPVIPNMMPTSPLAASHKNLLKTLNQGKVAAGRSKRQPSNSSDDEEGIVERRVSVRQSESAFRYKEIVVKKCPGYTQIWLFTSTKIKNSLNPKVFQELKEALKNARYDDSKLVMLSGSGSVFCSGIDLHYLMDDDRRMATKKMTEALKEFVQAIISFPKPIVAAVNGAAIGLGVAILPLCDIIYASDKASFSCPYSRLAQTPEGCATHTFPSVMGMAMANELLLGGRKLTAIEAYQIGLVSQVFWPTSMMQEVIPRIQNMASFSSRALEQSKLLMRNASKTKLDYAIEAECQSLLERWSSTECHRAFRTYLEEEQDLLV